MAVISYFVVFCLFSVMHTAVQIHAYTHTHIWSVCASYLQYRFNIIPVWLCVCLFALYFCRHNRQNPFKYFLDAPQARKDNISIYMFRSICLLLFPIFSILVQFWFEIWKRLHQSVKLKVIVHGISLSITQRKYISHMLFVFWMRHQKIFLCHMRNLNIFILIFLQVHERRQKHAVWIESIYLFYIDYSNEFWHNFRSFIFFSIKSCTYIEMLQWIYIRSMVVVVDVLNMYS